ncbi:MAG: hypothetical protein B6242_01015 [Anaerolineaceae bacterium 4572_78]|nr:MAG: hypothetical protein B6242_01015 [Anaerolineaceae bacterium 4572_78]
MTVFSLKSILQWHKHVRLFVKNPFLAIIKVVNIYAIKTHKITIQDQNLYDILDKYVKVLEEKTILAITSKIISISQKRVVKITDADREKLIEQESDYFLHANSHKYNVTLTIKNNWLIPTAGIDTSNGNGYYVLWPREPQQTANGIRSYLKKRHWCYYHG